MIRILTKKAFRFSKPGSGALSKPGVGETPEQASQRVMRDASERLTKAAQMDQYFDVQPGIVTDAPDWIRHDAIFEWASSDEDLMEIVPVSKANVLKDSPDLVEQALKGEAEPASDAPETEETEETEGTEEETEEDDPDGNMAGSETPGVEGGPVARRRIVGTGKTKTKAKGK